MIRKFVAISAIVLTAGCASSGSKLEPGATRAEVEKDMGKPTETLVRTNGDTLLYFSRLPDGRAMFLATIGPDGKLRTDVEQRLNRKNIVGIKAGMQAKEIRELLGPPNKSSRKTVSVAYESVQRDVWEYPWRDVSELRLLWLQFSADGVLREKIDNLDFEADPTKYLN